MSNTLKQIIDGLKSCLVPGRDFYPLHTPVFSGREWDFLKDCLDSTFVSSVGEYVNQFEQKLSEFSGAKHAVAVVNGTAALQVCLKLADVSDSDEVLIPSFSFVATANAVSYSNAVPHFIDINEQTLGIDPDKLGDYLANISEIRNGDCYNKFTDRKIKALVPMHTFGHPADLDRLNDIAKQFNLTLIEDAAESLGSYYKNKHTGTIGKLSALSFNGNKIITTGGGGAILTNDSDLAHKAKHITTTAKVSHPWKYIHDEIGFNYRMPNLNAALGCAQLEQMDSFLAKKRALAESFMAAFESIPGAVIFKESNFSRSNYWLNVLILNSDSSHLRDELIEASNAEGVMTRPAWNLLHRLKMFESCPRMDLSISEDLERRIINIPSGVGVVP